MAHARPLARRQFPAADALRDAMDLFSEIAEDKGVELALDAGPGIVVDADRSRLRQALANLVDNAVKYTPAGGRVSCSARVEGNAAVIEVRDTGTGIAPEDLPHIWDRLYRGDRSRSERGLGLGLSLVRAIVEAHGGRAPVMVRTAAELLEELLIRYEENGSSR
jgi:signal transduction histidine kinase